MKGEVVRDPPKKLIIKYKKNLVEKEQVWNWKFIMLWENFIDL